MGSARTVAVVGVGASVGAPDSVLGKVRLILQAFALDEPELGISEIARRTGLAKATVYRLCSELVETGFLERAGSQFRLSLTLFELGARVKRQREFRDLAIAHLQDLRSTTGETVHLGVPTRNEVLYIERLQGHEADAAPSRVAGKAPMHCTATGKSILAHLEHQAVDDILVRGLARRTRYTITMVNVLRTELDRIRDSGYSVEREEMRLGFLSVAAPVFGPGGRLIGAVSSTGPTRRTTVERMVGPVQTAAAAISREARSCWALS